MDVGFVISLALSSTNDHLLGVLEGLVGNDLPEAALIGGLAVTIRVAQHPAVYRATADLDLVTTESDPTFLELVAAGHVRGERIVIDGVKVDVIPTHPVTAAELEGIDDGPRLFAASHRRAIETCEPVALTTPTRPTSVVTNVATPAALVAMKSHAVGFARAERLATKHGSDLLDVFRLVEAFDQDGTLGSQISEIPGTVSLVIADVIRAQVLTNPARATTLMAEVSPIPVAVESVVDVLTTFVEDLEAQ
jgi:hypothetical protein